MWTVVVIIGLVAGGSVSGQLGATQFASSVECIAYLNDSLADPASRALPTIIIELAQDKAIKSFTITCGPV